MPDIHSRHRAVLSAFILLLGSSLLACDNKTNAETAAAEQAAADQAAADQAAADALAAQSEQAAKPVPAAPAHKHVTTAVPAPVCQDCGSISNIEKRKEDGKATGGGAVAGAILGAIAGRELVHGKRSHRDAAAVAGAVGGGYAGHKIEQKARSTTYYVVTVKMDSGSTQTVTLNSAEQISVGQKVRVQNGNIVLR